jgi:3-deoxy-D-manno-octulosonic-acid transferase
MLRCLSIFIYNLVIRLYYISILIASPFNQKARKWLHGRRSIQDQLEKIPPKKQFRVWMHVASLGEFEQGRSLLENIKSIHPESICIVSYFSPSGYEIRKNDPLADYSCYLPLDTKRNARKFIQRIDADLAIFIKYDFWYHHFVELKKQSIPLLVVSAIFTEKHIFFKKYAKLFRDILHIPSQLFVQNNSSKELLERIGIDKVSIIGDTRIDRVYQLAQKLREEDYQEIQRFKGAHNILILGSSYEKEEEILERHLEDKLPDWKLIIAPHDVSKKRIDEIRKRFESIPHCLLSELKKSPDLHTSRLLIINSIGLLNKLYNFTEIAFIGGGFNKSIHNLLEPATFGNAILFGPNAHHKFQEAEDLLSQGAALLLQSEDDFAPVIDQLIRNNAFQHAGQIAKKYIKEKQGGTQIVMNFIESNYLPK